MFLTREISYAEDFRTIIYFSGLDEIVVSGSGMVQATILDAINEIKYYHDNSFKAMHSPNSLRRLNLDVPHAVLSFVSVLRNNRSYFTQYSKNIDKINYL